MNPAEDISRGVTVKSLVESSKWLSSPDFLWKTSEEWPKQLAKASELPTEMQMSEKRIESVHSLLALQPPFELPLDRFILHFSHFFV